MRFSLALVLCVGVAGCAAVIDEDFEDYVHTPAPTTCNPADPWDASGQFVRCAADETCEYSGPDGSSATTPTHPRCVSIFDYLPLGASCSYANECGAGAACTLAHGCVRFCDLDRPVCDPGEQCVPFDPAATSGGHRFGFCRGGCDPVASSCAGTCSFYEASSTACFLDTGPGNIGEACVSDGDCQAGMACNGAAQQCTRYCRVGFADCGANACVSTDTPPLSYGGITYGYCEL